MPPRKISSGIVHEMPADLRKALASDPKALTASGAVPTSGMGKDALAAGRDASTGDTAARVARFVPTRRATYNVISEGFDVVNIKLSAWSPECVYVRPYQAMHYSRNDAAVSLLLSFLEANLEIGDRPFH